MKKTLVFLASCALLAGVAFVGTGSVSAAPGSNNGNGGSGGGNARRMTVELTDYRFRNDDGSETAATWVAPLNTPISLAPGEDVRLRVRVAETADVRPKRNEDSIKPLWWQYRIVGETIGFDPQVTQCNSPHYDDSVLWGDDTTEQFEEPSANYITDNEGLFDGNSSRTNVDLEFAPLRDVELEICLKLPVDAEPGDIVEFKVDGVWNAYSLDGVVNMPVIHVI